MNTPTNAFTSISLDDVRALGDVDQALAGYFDDAVAAAAAASGIDERTIRDWVENELISEQGFRSQVLTGPGDDGQAVLVAFEDAHLVRSDARRGAQWFELSHDRLVDPVRSGNEAWRAANLAPLQLDAMSWNQQGRPDAMLLSGDALTAGEQWSEANEAVMSPLDHEYLEASREAAAGALLIQRASRRTKVFAAVAAVVTLLAIAIGSIAFSLSRESDELRKARASADEQRDLAEANAAEARANADQARANADEAAEQRRVAEENLAAAEFALDEAEAQRRIADEQRQLAEDNAADAERQRQLAEDNAAEAEAQRQLAEDNAADANEQREIAEEQRQIAEDNADEAARQTRIAQQQTAIAQQQTALAEEQAQLAEASRAEAERLSTEWEANASCVRGLIFDGTTQVGQSILFDLDRGDFDSLRNLADLLINSFPAYLDYDINCPTPAPSDL